MLSLYPSSHSQIQILKCSFELIIYLRINSSIFNNLNSSFQQHFFFIFIQSATNQPQCILTINLFHLHLFYSKTLLNYYKQLFSLYLIASGQNFITFKLTLSQINILSNVSIQYQERLQQTRKYSCYICIKYELNIKSKQLNPIFSIILIKYQWWNQDLIFQSKDLIGQDLCQI
ncbi:unnamed protein product (macronuclear) [Paramecium tetraurelia]|uniref:Transmembrane protein n=1 Tax=Paramecium tetraurelia TaxID=5888 RepID=A0BJ42_PARTE|nr:uncharacterized protein GSPATT00004932001 [Paramecium tetraurelia]CAK58559.1 unnamed protein product [Paramecium tetraurelia]|eukprot:XP_001425957.1 hypothetical protein (macronuclear) [Paramecium tetraurelia strain d4-2]